MLNITPDQLAAAGGYIGRQWGDYGYRIKAVEQPTPSVAAFRVVCTGDGSRFTVLADKWGNCRHVDTHDGDSGLLPAIREMHALATGA